LCESGRLTYSCIIKNENAGRWKMNCKSTSILATAIAVAALAASVPARADSCNQSTYVRGGGNYVVNNCIVERDTDRDPPAVYYPAPVYPALMIYGSRPMPFFFFRGFRR
jgi:hypothetical protein